MTKLDSDSWIVLIVSLTIVFVNSLFIASVFIYLCCCIETNNIFRSNTSINSIGNSYLKRKACFKCCRKTEDNHRELNCRLNLDGSQNIEVHTGEPNRKLIYNNNKMNNSRIESFISQLFIISQFPFVQQLTWIEHSIFLITVN